MKAFYAKTKEEVFNELNTSDRGLTNDEVKKRIEEYGFNEFKEKKTRTTFQKFMDQFKDFLVLILIGAAIISGFVGEVADSIIILLVVIINATLGVIQENKAEESLKALKKMAAPLAHVIRNGISLEIPVREIVPGDLVVLEAGRYVPADLRLIETSNLKIEESSLTGESVPVEKNDRALDSENIGIGDRKNMAFMSSMVTYGRGKGIVVATGMKTEIGKIADMLANVEEEQTPLQIKLEEAGKWMGIAALVICGIMFIVGILKGKELLEMFMTSISLAVAAIPEGLPAVVTIVLAVGVQKMIKRNAIIRKLPAVETLGCATVICSDKTGTLTQNKMTVKRIYTINGFADDITDAKKVIYISNLCNDTKIVDEDGKYKTIGDPTETALIDMAFSVGIDKRKLDEEYVRIEEIPFDSDRKLMTTFNKNGDKIEVNTKGAPDILLSRCKYVLDGDKIREITNEDLENIKNANEEMAKNALRVLAAGYKVVDKVEIESAENDLIFAGLIGMIDPPREEAKDAVHVCKTAGIKPVMITGDHKSTAIAIAKELGILNDESEAITGAELEKMSDDELFNNVKKYSVYARVSPEHKVRIVEAWKKNGQIVAMTGDGVNDAPALKTANIGAAMGITGTDVAKEAADMVLTDDNFATIVSAVEEGRTIYSNIKKSISYLLSCNIGEIVTLFVATLLGWAEPLLPIHILWVNLVTDSLPALALGMEAAEPGVMKQPPRDPDEGIFSKGAGFRILLQGIFIGVVTLIAYVYGVNYGKARGMSFDEYEILGRTMAFFTLSLSQLVHAFNNRYETKSVLVNGIFKNKYLNLAATASFIIQLIVLASPFLRNIFKVTLLNGEQIMVVAACSIAPLFAVEIAKFIRKQK
ncbi:Calcium-transporting ATPase 1 [Caloramator mitchellensis]|uniref:P-type Ca(2+) transporter n=1 Tax=Caloramator mitchellensis TaxID=908809 RepID=A0A0R3JTG4_CALMK|nr:calcium-transporting P-type ATPase, PMR1-type [Caloramator mitchellensis]KRQ86795.1 Calcium-transporting ATPase 1 [Caloramator mitchellensis]